MVGVAVCGRVAGGSSNERKIEAVEDLRVQQGRVCRGLVGIAASSELSDVVPEEVVHGDGQEVYVRQFPERGLVHAVLLLSPLPRGRLLHF